MQMKTTTVASWSPQTAGRAKRHYINKARSALAKQAQYGLEAPETMEIPDSIMEAHARRYNLRLAGLKAQGFKPLEGE